MAGSVLECTGSYFSLPAVEKKMVKISTFFPCQTTPFSVVQLFDGCRPRVSVSVQCACNRAGCVDRDGEGSTGPSRGEHRLTVYRAHTSASQKNRIFDHKNEEISRSVNSFDTGSIFRPRLGHDPSRNTSVVSTYAFYGNSHVRKYFL